MNRDMTANELSKKIGMTYGEIHACTQVLRERGVDIPKYRANIHELYDQVLEELQDEAPHILKKNVKFKNAGRLPDKEVTYEPASVTINSSIPSGFPLRDEGYRRDVR